MRFAAYLKAGIKGVAHTLVDVFPEFIPANTIFRVFGEQSYVTKTVTRIRGNLIVRGHIKHDPFLPSVIPADTTYVVLPGNTMFMQGDTDLDFTIQLDGYLIEKD